MGGSYLQPDDWCHGCPCCSGRVACEENSLATIYPDLAVEWHPTNNEGKTPADYPSKSEREAWWLCANGHTWKTKICNRAYGSGCPDCKRSASKGEVAVKNALIKLNVKFKEQFPLKRNNGRHLRFDFAVAVAYKRGLIEYQGLQHYRVVDYFGGQPEFERRQKWDHIKRTVCQRYRLPLLEIPYWDYDKVDELVGEFIKSLS